MTNIYLKYLYPCLLPTEELGEIKTRNSVKTTRCSEKAEHSLWKEVEKVSHPALPITLTFIKYLCCARHCFKCFICINPCNPYNNLLILLILLIASYSCFSDSLRIVQIEANIKKLDKNNNKKFNSKTLEKKKIFFPSKLTTC